MIASETAPLRSRLCWSRLVLQSRDREGTVGAGRLGAHEQGNLAGQFGPQFARLIGWHRGFSSSQILAVDGSCR